MYFWIFWDFLKENIEIAQKAFEPNRITYNYKEFFFFIILRLV